MNNRERPKIGFFDSGVGGLSVFSEFADLYGDQVDYYYFLDQNGFPYGKKSETEIKDLILSYLIKVVNALSIDLVVIACNTASTVALDAVRSVLKIPVVGVVPAIKVAAETQLNGSCAILLTELAARQPYVRKLISKFGQGKKFEIIPAAGLVDEAESFVLDGKVDIDKIRHSLKRLFEISDLESVVLGCTHFPCLKNLISDLIGREIVIIDSGKAVAVRAGALLNLSENQSKEKMSLTIINNVTSFHAIKYLGFSQKMNIFSCVVSSFTEL